MSAACLDRRSGVLWLACTTPQAYERDGVRVAPWQDVVEDLVRLM